MWTENNKAISEVNTILKQLNQESRKKIPKQLLDELEKNAKFNEDNTKIILDPQYDGVGHGIETIRFTGNGRLDYTTIYISYNIIGEGDKAKEVQFADADLKQYIQENCDYDRDKKITEYENYLYIYNMPSNYLNEFDKEIISLIDQMVLNFVKFNMKNQEKKKKIKVD